MADKDMGTVFSQNLSRLLCKHDMLQLDLAKQLGVAPSSVNAWVKGTTIPRTPMIRKIMEVFGCELDDLMINRYLTEDQLLQIYALGFTVSPDFDDMKNDFWDLTDNDVPQELRFSVVKEDTGDKVVCTRDQIISALNASIPFTEFFNRMLKRRNNSDDELTEYLEILRTRPECRTLFSLIKDATKENVERTVAIIAALRAAEEK